MPDGGHGAEAEGTVLFAPEYPHLERQHTHPQIPLYGGFVLVKLRWVV